MQALIRPKYSYTSI